MTKHQHVVAWLREHVGQHEVPMGSNTGAFVRSCQAATWLPGSRWPWCVATWVKAWTVAGYKLPYKGAGAYAMLAWYKAHAPNWVVPLALARPGSAVILNIGAGHLATLVKPYDGHGVVYTIDGNWGNKVTPVTHPASLVRGCVDPPETHAIAPAKPPVFDVVRSASGHSKVVFTGGQTAVGQKVAKLLNTWGGVTIRRRKKKAA